MPQDTVLPPASAFYVAGGTLPHEAPSYVTRQADTDLFESLVAGEFCYVLNTRQMGKSSLMVRTASRLREAGVDVAVLDLSAVGQNLSPDQWYDGLLLSLAAKLGLENPLDDFWAENPKMGPMQRFFAAIEQVVLPALSRMRATVLDTKTPGTQEEQAGQSGLPTPNARPGTALLCSAAAMAPARCE